jgi:hypothetical protein
MAVAFLLDISSRTSIIGVDSGLWAYSAIKLSHVSKRQVLRTTATPWSAKLARNTGTLVFSAFGTVMHPPLQLGNVSTTPLSFDWNSNDLPRARGIAARVACQSDVTNMYALLITITLSEVQNQCQHRYRATPSSLRARHNSFH